MADERHATPLIPPTTAPPLPPPPALPLAPPHRPTRGGDLVIGIAAVNHSGRVRDAAVMSALGWAPGQRIAVKPTQDAILLRRDPTAAHRVDGRGLVFLPAGIRALLGIAANTRILLVAVPAHDLLAVDPCAVVTALLATAHTELATTTPPKRPPGCRLLPRPGPPAAAATTHLPLVAIQPDTP